MIAALLVGCLARHSVEANPSHRVLNVPATIASTIHRAIGFGEGRRNHELDVITIRHFLDQEFFSRAPSGPPSRVSGHGIARSFSLSFPPLLSRGCLIEEIENSLLTKTIPALLTVQTILALLTVQQTDQRSGSGQRN